MSDTPPAWPPFYFSGGWFRMGSDEPQFKLKGKFEFEFLNSDEGDDPALAAAFYAADFPTRVAGEPRWLATGGWEIVPGETSSKGRIHSAAFTARRADTEVAGRVVFSPDPSHWVKVEVFLGAFRVLVAHMDKVWEEFELWPSGATEKTIDPPGRIGKRLDWINLAPSAWPALARLAGDHTFSIELPGRNVVEISAPGD
ncbi:hypothetical protein [Mesorhizobium australicum]|uniref:Uncharacterized protein n=1 Tax=Mesorhizobium australicum TaxID=536018 RepID=A0A1X7PE34_9HYPH|nr:hypothetical protein [Mesorhizobium australicum]SMH49576.1 hypothetical protein SAMN02982922_3943 [Mesorhizobium australicum]